MNARQQSWVNISAYEKKKVLVFHSENENRPLMQTLQLTFLNWPTKFGKDQPTKHLAWPLTLILQNLMSHSLVHI